jgi:hypothetical protein
MNPGNIADRIRMGLQAITPPDELRVVASEATTQGITEASPMLLRAWADDVLKAANKLDGQAGQHWASIAAEMRSLAWERSTGCVNGQK